MLKKRNNVPTLPLQEFIRSRPESGSPAPYVLHAPEGIVEPVPSEFVTRREPRDTTDFDNEDSATRNGRGRRVPRRSTSPGMEQDTETRVEESTKMFNHCTQIFENPFEKNGDSPWKEASASRLGFR
ncbi:hypothetical protein JTB14_009346 [Gonioctena quinquepunctata]|nr:hypothetical protein JTB14_009346 [Gonioctena quinquepunctata]